jgi:Flp pilus assembly protein TadD
MTAKSSHRRPHEREAPTAADTRLAPVQGWFWPAFVVAAALVYGPALRGGILWDDIGHLTSADLHPVSGLWRIWFDVGATQQYYPVVHSVFWIFNRLWGWETLPYHIVNVLLHATSAFLLVHLLRRLEVRGAALAGFLFLVHPVAVESVAWITELKNTLSTVFYLAAALAYLRFDENRHRRFFIAAFACFLLAVFAKTVTATLPAALLVVFWWRRARIEWARDVLPLLPFFAVGIVAGLMTAWVERTIIGAEGAGYELGLVERALLASRIVWFYLATLVWPSDVMFMYPRWNVSRAIWWQYLYPAALVGAFVLLSVFRSRSRAPLAFALLYVGTLVPALGFVDVYPFRYSFVADHFQYLASLSALAAISALLVTLVRESRGRETLLGLVIGVPLALLSWRESANYTTNERLFESTLARNPDCWMCHHNLAALETDRGDERRALEHFASAVALRPQDARLQHDLAIAYGQFGRVEDSLRAFRIAIDLAPDGPLVRQDYGEALRRAGRVDDAAIQFAEAVRLAPDSPTAQAEMGVILLEQRQPTRAVGYLRESLRLDPSVATVHVLLARALRSLGHFGEAIVHVRDAIRIEPGNPAHYNDLADCLIQTGRPNEAIDALREGVRRDPSATVIRVNLAIGLGTAGRLDEAETEFREVLRQDPRNDIARAGLEEIARTRMRATAGARP